MKKVCRKCDTEKDLDLFNKNIRTKDGFSIYCRDCTKIMKKADYEKNKENYLLSKQNYYLDNKELLYNKQKNYRSNNKEKLYVRDRQYYLDNKEYIDNKQKEYRTLNRGSAREYHKNYISNRMKTDNLFYLSTTIRGLIRKSVLGQGYNKNSNTLKILGCSFKEFKEYLESKFEPWMNWENYGKYNGHFNYGWDIDHIIPSSSAKTEEDIYKLNNFSNLQPLCSKINRDIKKDNIII